MKTIVVYFSLTGNAEYAARKAAEALGADLLALSPEKAYPASGPMRFLMGGKSAVMGEAPALLPYAFDPRAYGRIVFVTPVWASTFAPPLRTFIRAQRARWTAARFALIACCSGGNAEKAADKLAAELGVDWEARLTLVDPKSRPAPGNAQKLSDFCARLMEDEG